MSTDQDKVVALLNDMDADAVETQTGEFWTPPSGLYIATVDEIKAEATDFGGYLDTPILQVRFVYTIADGEHEGRKIYADWIEPGERDGLTDMQEEMAARKRGRLKNNVMVLTGVDEIPAGQWGTLFQAACDACPATVQVKIRTSKAKKPDKKGNIRTYVSDIITELMS